MEVIPLLIISSNKATTGLFYLNTHMFALGSAKSIRRLLGGRRNLLFPYNQSWLIVLSSSGDYPLSRSTPSSSQLDKYIITSIDYFTRWTKAILLKQVNDNQVISFLNQNIITRFGVPSSLLFCKVNIIFIGERYKDKVCSKL